MKYLKMHYDSNRNITFNNEGDEDYFPLPSSWDDDMTKEDQEAYIDSENESYLWELVEVWSEVVDESEVPERDR